MAVSYAGQGLEIVFIVLLAVASLSDIKKLQIDNFYPISIFALFILHAFFAKDILLTVFLSRIFLSIVILLCGFLLCFFKIWGAGDAKLLASNVLWISSDKILWFLLITAVFVGVVSIFYWFLSFCKNGFKKTGLKAIKGLKIPCAVAFFLGTIVVFVS